MSGARDMQDSGGAFQEKVEIVNKRGLHARAAASFVKVAGQFDADISVQKGGNDVSGLSIMGLMMLAASTGCHITISARGNDAGAALSALVELVENRFGED